MIKKLLLTAALLTPGLAYGQVSAPLDPPVAPAGSNQIACDIGPPYTGTIPAAAVQAFGPSVHCVANYDYTQTQPWISNGKTYQWSNMGSWFACNNKGTDATILYVLNSNIACDTNHENITTDGGTQVLQLSQTLADATSGVGGGDIDTATFAGPPPGYVAAVPLPVSFYYEGVVRPSTNAPCSGCLYWDVSTVQIGGFSGQNYCWFGGDYDEFYGGLPTNAGISGWNFANGNSCGTGGYWYGPSGSFVAAPEPSSTSYNTYGFLQEGDGDAGGGGCNYYQSGAVSGLSAAAFISCLTQATGFPTNQSGSNGVLTGLQTSRQYIYHQWGSIGCGSGCSNWTPSNFSMNIQRETFWSCLNWKTQQCPINPLVTSHP